MPTCRACGAPLSDAFLSLGKSPISNAFLTAAQLTQVESFYPLDLFHCARCHLVQILDCERAEDHFHADYAYFSSFSESWLAHCRAYVEMIAARLDLGPDSFVVEVASNDGYLLQYMVERGVDVLGVEPTANTAAAAVERGVPTEVTFFTRDYGTRLAEQGRTADLIIGNNVFAHMPDLNDFIAGLAAALKPTGTVTLEVPHLLQLIAHNQFDTVYHEHYSYVSLLAAAPRFAAHGLQLYDVEELGTHGGSVRLYVGHEGAHAVRPAVAALIARERAEGLDDPARFRAFRDQVEATKRALLRFLIDAREAGKTVVGYGAPAKGNTLLNYCGVRTDLLPFTVDKSPHKQGKYLPGTHIPVLTPEAITEAQPDYVLILPWNIQAEIRRQMAHIAEWGGRFVVPIPTVQVLD